MQTVGGEVKRRKEKEERRKRENWKMGQKTCSFFAVVVAFLRLFLTYFFVTAEVKVTYS